jgi:predicted transposase YdaD
MGLLHLHDPRESRFAKEMREEGRLEGMEEGLAVAARRLAKKFDLSQIATLLQWTEEQVRRALESGEQH